MRFAEPKFALLLLFLPVLVGLVLWFFRRRKKNLNRYADSNLIPIIAPYISSRKEKLKYTLKILIFCLLVLALAEPQWGMKEEEVRMRGINVMILADVSASMLAEDIKPNRLEREKRKIKDLVKILAGDRVGLIAFAGRSFLLAPLTVDYGTLDRYIDDLGPETIPVKGTDLAGALQLAIRSFPEKEEGKAIILFTDGEDHSEKIPELLKIIKKEGIQLYIMGIGTPEGAPIPDIQGGFKTDRRGQQVHSSLKEEFLKNLALESNGAYVRTVTGDEDLEELYLKGLRQNLTPENLKVTHKRVWENRFYWPLGLAFFFFVLERLIPEGGKEKEEFSLT